MVRQQLQRRFGILALEGIGADRADRKPNRACEHSIFLAALNLVNPVGSDMLTLYKDGVSQHGVLPFLVSGQGGLFSDYIRSGRPGRQDFSHLTKYALVRFVTDLIQFRRIRGPGRA